MVKSVLSLNLRTLDPQLTSVIATEEIIKSEKCSNGKGNNNDTFVEVILDNNNYEKKRQKLESSSCEIIPPENNNESENLEKVRRGWKQYIGMILAIWSSVFLSLVLLLVKVLNNYHPFSTSFWRQFGNVIPSIAMVVYYRYWKKENIFDSVWPLTSNYNENWTNVVGLALRGFLGATTVILRFYALEFLTIADATVVTYSGPIFIVIMAHFFLKEKCGVTPIATGLWTLMGVILICRPPFLTGEEIHTTILIGTGISLGVVLCTSTVTILVRKIRKIHFSVMTLAFGICGLLQSSIITFSAGVFSVPKGFTDISLTALLATLSFLGQMCGILALKYEEAGPVSLVRTCDVLFAFLWQIVFLDVLPDLYSILGATIVMIGVFLTCFRKWISALPEEDFKKKLFKFLLT